MRTRPRVALMGIVVGAVIAAALWKAWQVIAGRVAAPSAAAGVPTSASSDANAGDEIVVSPPTATPPPAPGGTPESPPLPPAPPPMPFGAVFDPLATLTDEDTMAGSLPAEDVKDDDVTSSFGTIEETAERETASEPTDAGQSVAAQHDRAVPDDPGNEASQSRSPESLREQFGPDAMTPIARGVCPDDFPVKGNANSMIFHLPGQSTYVATIPEVCFRDSDAAEAAGFRPRRR